MVEAIFVSYVDVFLCGFSTSAKAVAVTNLTTFYNQRLVCNQYQNVPGAYCSGNPKLINLPINYPHRHSLTASSLMPSKKGRHLQSAV